MARYPFLIVDVFTSERFGGNQLAVLPDASGLDDRQMRVIAREMNFSETTFVFPSEAGGDAKVRIFTPVVELPFAGHPTVGTGWALGRERGLDAVTLELKVGPIAVAVDRGDGERGAATMTQPLPRFWPAEASAADAAAMFSLERSDVDGRLPLEFGSAGVDYLMLPLKSRAALAKIVPDGDLLQAFFEGSSHPAVYLFTTDTGSTARARMLGLLIGSSVSEDPATGSACGPCGAYLVRHGVCLPGRVNIEQGYEMGRPSQMAVDVEANGGEITSVKVGGGVVLVAEGELLV